MAGVRPRDIARLIWTFHDKHERWQALYEVHLKLPDAVFLPEFVKVWTNSESNDRFLPLIDRLVEARGVCAERVMPLLSAKERDVYAALPDEFEVYRGTVAEEPFGDYSWSTDRDKAIWFAHRCPEGTPTLYTGRVRKADTFFSYAGGGESEIAVHTDQVINRQSETLAPYKQDAHGAFFFAVQNGLFGQDRLMWVMRLEFEMKRRGCSFPDVLEEAFRPIEVAEKAGFIDAPAKMRAMIESVTEADVEKFRCATEATY